MTYAAEIKIRAERKLGDLLAEMPKRDGGDAARIEAHLADQSEVPPKLSDLGISHFQSHQWQQMAV